MTKRVCGLQCEKLREQREDDDDDDDDDEDGQAVQAAAASVRHADLSSGSRMQTVS